MWCLAHLLSSIMYPSKSNLKIFFKISKVCQLLSFISFQNSSHSNTFKIGQIMSLQLETLKKLTIVPKVEAEDFTMACEVPHDPGVPGMLSPQDLWHCWSSIKNCLSPEYPHRYLQVFRLRVIFSVRLCLISLFEIATPTFFPTFSTSCFYFSP